MFIAEAKIPDKNSGICGVRLLQLIFSNLRRSQLALNPQLKGQNKTFLASASPSSSVDPLYIRPTERQETAGSKDVFAGEMLYAKRKTQMQNGLPAVTMGATVQTPGDNMYGDSALQSNRSAMNASHAKKAAAANAGKADSFATSMAVNTATATAPVPVSANAQSAYQGMSPENARMITNSLTGLFKTTKQMSELSAEPQGSVKTYGGMARARASSQMADTKVIANQPLITEYGGASGGTITAAQNAVQRRGANLVPANMAPMLQTEGSGHALSLAGRDASDDAEDKETTQALQPNQPGLYRNFRSPLTALLPPNVVGGIPIARLGATSKELAGSVKAPVFRQTVDDWTVWTVPADGDSPAVQLFMRNRVLEAIRVFSQPYLGQEVGVQIGDTLMTIKKKFGEPELLLPEPDLTGRRHSPMSQNYIYPLSHVAFQLARVQAHSQPQVVSVLVFDVQ